MKIVIRAVWRRRGRPELGGGGDIAHGARNGRQHRRMEGLRSCRLGHGSRARQMHGSDLLLLPLRMVMDGWCVARYGVGSGGGNTE